MLRRHEARTQQSNGASRTDTATQKTQKEELATELTNIAENFRVAARKATADSNSRLCSKGQSGRLKQLSTRCDLLEAASNSSFCMLQDGPWYLRQVHDSIHDADKIRAELVKTSKTTYQTTAQAVDDSQAQLSALSFKAYIFSHLDDENSVIDLGHNKVDVAFWHYGVDGTYLSLNHAVTPS